jgi:hypothetical protein
MTKSSSRWLRYWPRLPHGFKLQAFVNNPKRTRDTDDIRHLLRNNSGALNMQQVRGYFALFQREPLLDELLSDNR